MGVAVCGDRLRVMAPAPSAAATMTTSRYGRGHRARPPRSRRSRWWPPRPSAASHRRTSRRRRTRGARRSPRRPRNSAQIRTAWPSCNDPQWSTPPVGVGLSVAARRVAPPLPHRRRPPRSRCRGGRPTPRPTSSMATRCKTSSAAPSLRWKRSTARSSLKPSRCLRTTVEPQGADAGRGRRRPRAARPALRHLQPRGRARDRRGHAAAEGVRRVFGGGRLRRAVGAAEATYVDGLDADFLRGGGAQLARGLRRSPRCTAAAA